MWNLLHVQAFPWWGQCTEKLLTCVVNVSPDWPLQWTYRQSSSTSTSQIVSPPVSRSKINTCRYCTHCCRTQADLREVLQYLLWPPRGTAALTLTTSRGCSTHIRLQEVLKYSHWQVGGATWLDSLAVSQFRACILHSMSFVFEGSFKG